MLNVEADFPNLFSKALLIDGPRAEPCKIVQLLGGRGRNREVAVSILGREGSTARRRVLMKDLADAAPLDASETAELAELERALTGQAVSERSPKYRRYMALTQRAAHAERLAREEAAACRRDFYAGMRPRSVA